MQDTYATKSDFFRNKKSRVSCIKEENKKDEIRLVASILTGENKDWWMSITDTLDDSIERMSKINNDLANINVELAMRNGELDEVMREEEMFFL